MGVNQKISPLGKSQAWYRIGARYYDPDLGIWTQPDAMRQFASPYLYTGNGYNPINGVDPDGNVVIAFGGKISMSFYVGIDFSFQPAIALDSFNPLDWQFGFTASKSPSYGTGTGGWGGAVFTFAPWATKIEDLNGSSVSGGGSLTAGMAVFGFDAASSENMWQIVKHGDLDSPISYEDAASVNFSISFGCGKEDTKPLPISGEIHEATGNTVGGGVTFRELFLSE